MLRFLVVVPVCLLVFSAYAKLEPMDDDALAQQQGQALFKLTETPDSETVQNGISFTKVEFGLKLELNANVEELILGRYHRNPGNGNYTGSSAVNGCHDGGRFCDNDTGAAFSQWNCSVAQCGGIDKHGVPGNDVNANPFSASALVYGDFFGYSEITKGQAAQSSAGILTSQTAYRHSVPFTNTNVFPSQFEITRGADARLRDVSLGRVVNTDSDGFLYRSKRDPASRYLSNTDFSALNINENTIELIPEAQRTYRKLEPFVLEKPYVEFAYDDSSGAREIAGLRIGYGSATGIQGNAIDVLSGFVQPVINARLTGRVVLILSGSADYEFSPYLGGVRTPGYLDPRKSLPGYCNGGGILGNRFCEQTSTGDTLAHTSPQAQLFPLQQVRLNKSPSFWFSLQDRPINYSNDKSLVNDYDVQEIEYEQAQPGLWVNLGAYKLIRSDGTAVPFSTTVRNTTGNDLPLNLLREASGFQANVLEPAHPDNYFSAHPSASKYPQQNNYY